MRNILGRLTSFLSLSEETTMRSIAGVLLLAATVSGAPTAGSQETGKIPITTSSEAARALFLRGRALNETLTGHDARVPFEQAIALDPAFALDEYYLASTAPTANDRSAHLAKAVALVARASAGERLMILGMQARVHADRALERQLAESLVALYPRDERAHGVLALVYAGRREYANEIAEYQKAVAINPGYALAYNQLGYAYRSLGDMSAAESAFERYIAAMPNDPNPYDSYAELLMKMGRFDESIVQYRKALAIDPHFGASHIGIAADEMYSGRTGNAVGELRKYHDSARDDGERRSALFNEAMVHVDHGGTDAALQAMEKSYALARASGDTLNMAADDVVAADILLDAGRLDAARERYTRAHDLVAASSLPAAVKADDALARGYDAARLALARHDVGAARADASAYLIGATERKNDARVRQAHALNGAVALEEKQFDRSLAELALGDQEDPAVWYTMARAWMGKGDKLKAGDLTARAAHMNILPTLPYVFTRAAISGATQSATAGTPGGRPR
jgi:superkiller protein 3